MQTLELSVEIGREDGKEMTPAQIDRLSDKIIDFLEGSGYIAFSTPKFETR